MGAAVGTDSKGSVNVELNIVPFIDLMSCLTAFLLVPAVWVNIAQINIQPKGKTRDTANVQQDDEHVTLSVLVQSDQIWIGLSRVNEFTPIPKLAMSLSILAIRRLHRSGRFASMPARWQPIRRCVTGRYVVRFCSRHAMNTNSSNSTHKLSVDVS